MSTIRESIKGIMIAPYNGIPTNPRKLLDGYLITREDTLLIKKKKKKKAQVQVT